MSEKNKKKAYFIKKTIRTLKLSNAHVLDEAITSKTLIPQKFDIITARALAAAPKIIEFYDLLKPLGYEIGKLYPNYIEIYETYKYYKLDKKK